MKLLSSNNGFLFVLDRAMAAFFVKLIRYYQAAFSPDHSPRRALYPLGYCRYYPSCSEYGAQALLKHGFIKGALYSAWRILRCNPFSRGGHDPIK